MRCSPPSPHSSASNYSSSAVSESPSINLEELVFALVGDFELRFFSNGRLVTCGTLGRLQDGLPLALPPTVLSAPERPPSVLHADHDLTMLSSPYETQMPMCRDADVNYMDVPADAALTASPTPGGLAFAVLPAPASPPAPAALPKGLSARAGRRRGERALLHSARRTFVLDAIPLQLPADTVPQLSELWDVLSGYTQTDCKVLALASLTILRPTRRVTHPYGSEPPAWWPRAVRYIDSAHLVIHERQALLAHLWFSPQYAKHDIMRIPAHATVRQHLGGPSLTRLFELVLAIRAAADAD